MVSCYQMRGQLICLIWSDGLYCIFAEFNIDCLTSDIADAVLGLDFDSCGLLLKAIDLCELEHLPKELLIFVEDYLYKLVIVFELRLLELGRQNKRLIGSYRILAPLQRKQGTLIV